MEGCRLYLIVQSLYMSILYKSLLEGLQIRQSSSFVPFIESLKTMVSPYHGDL
eukprot:c50537_g1_i1 orf=61-219(+)